MRIVSIIILCFLGLVLIRLSAYTVDAAEYAYVTILGRHVATHDGGKDGAGLHFGWPWPVQAVQRLDRRVQEFDLPASEHLFSDEEGKTVDKNLSIQAFVVWRISDRDGVDRFVRRIGTAERAKNILTNRVQSQLGATRGKMRLDDIVNTDPERVDRHIQAWQAALMDSVKEQANTEYGIELIDIRLRRFNYPEETRKAIFARIRSERQKKVTEYEEDGKLQAKNIVSTADEKYRTTLADARFQEERLKGLADTEAMLIRNQAYSQDPEFYAFLKKMEKLQTILGENRTVLLLSTHRPLFDLLFSPPRPEPGVRNQGSGIGSQESGKKLATPTGNGTNAKGGN